MTGVDAIADAAQLARLSGEIIQAGSKSFSAASSIFDVETRTSAHLLYAWCRHCDDVIDGQELGFAGRPVAPPDAAAALSKLRQQTNDALAGKAMREPVFQAFQVVMAKHQIPARHAYELLDGFAMDVDGREYRTIDETLTYCYHVAGVVGVMMAMIMGVRADKTLDRASDLGIGFQLTNISRDLVADAASGRCYVPAEWLAEAGLTAATVSDPSNRQALFGVATRLIRTADSYYASSRYGIRDLPLRSGWAIGTARAVYRQIGRGLMRQGPAALNSRMSTSNMQKLGAAMVGIATAVNEKTFGRWSEPPPRDGLWTRPKQ